MTAFPPGTVLRWLVAALLLAVGVIGMGGTATASCGDYLTIDGKRHAMPLGGPVVPCHGPNCSANPAPIPEPMTAPAPVTAGAKEWAAGLILLGDDTPPPAGFVRPVSDGELVHLPLSVFHPPRHS